MGKSSGSLSLAQETFFDLFQLAFVHVGVAQGFDGHFAVDLGVPPEIDRSHSSLPEFLYNLVAAESRTGGGIAQKQRPVGIGDGGVDRLTQTLQGVDALLNISETTGFLHVAVHGHRFVEHSFALEILSEVVEQIPHGPVFHRTFTKLFECHIQHSLALE